MTEGPEPRTSVASVAPIAARYLLLQASTPLFVDPAGRRWLDRLWAIDAGEHARHLRRLLIACPFIRIDASAASHVAVDADPALATIEFMEVPRATSRLQALLQLPRTAWRVWRAVRGADVVHLGVAGWPYPLGWIGWPVARLLRKPVIAVVESAPWRAPPGSRPSMRKRLESAVYESLGRAIVRGCGLRFFTTEQYARSLGAGDVGRDHVVEASWIPEEQVVGPAVVAELLRRDPARPLRLALFSRINADKGVHVLLDALSQAAHRTDITLDIWGEGPALAEVAARLRDEPGLARASLCGTLAYGTPLFERIRDYDWIVVPNLGDEQPRIVYDAYSQGVPVLASNTSGLRQCVIEGETGHFFAIGDAPALAALIEHVASPPQRAARGAIVRRCVDVARTKTHAAMHAQRARLVARFLGIA